MIGIPVALGVFGAGEWAVHRYLHPAPQHHVRVTANGGYDPAYEGWPWTSPTQRRELAVLAGLAVAHVPLLPIAPFYAGTMLYCLHRYRRDHRRAHLDPAWARDHLPHHYEHHLGQRDRNFGVVWSWVDSLTRTRDRFIGTLAERGTHAANLAKVATAVAGAAVRAQRRNPFRRLLANARAAASARSPAPTSRSRVFDRSRPA